LTTDGTLIYRPSIYQVSIVRLTRVEFHVLLSLLDSDRHGYGIMQDVERLTDGEVRLGPGTLYTAIARLVASGFIEDCESDDERRRRYAITKKGKTAAADEAKRLATLVRTARKRGLLPSASS
jgi:DNA-binding PadR family transcriptional regulator